MGAKRSYMEDLQKKIRDIYNIASDLERMFPGRKFTPDGRMVGSIGEAIAAAEYHIVLHGKANHPRTDGVASGKEVQIKTTQRNEIAMKKPLAGDLLLVLKIDKEAGDWTTVYYGDAGLAWRALKNQKKNYMREKTISLAKLRRLQGVNGKTDTVRLLDR
jgi:4-hydroxy-3-methylbut-2-enyl diphosphate reductase IspH